jgi:SAM-dependent methyltransferase
MKIKEEPELLRETDLSKYVRSQDRSVTCPICLVRETSPLYFIPPRKLVCCRRCGHEYVDPVPTSISQDCSFPSFKDDDLPTRIDCSYISGVLERHPPPNRKLLDVGCGEGRIAKRLVDTGWEETDIHLVDSSAASLAAARTHLPYAHLTCSDVELRSVFSEQRFGCVILVEMFEHIPEPRRVLEWVAASLAPGGLGIIRAMPNNHSLHAYLAGERWRMRRFDQHLQFFNPETLARLVGSLPGITLAEYGTFLQPGFSFYHPIRVARDLGLAFCDASNRALGNSTDPEVLDAATHAIIEAIATADMSRYPLRRLIPVDQLLACGSPNELGRLFDEMYLDYRIAPDFSAVLVATGG